VAHHSDDPSPYPHEASAVRCASPADSPGARTATDAIASPLHQIPIVRTNEETRDGRRSQSIRESDLSSLVHHSIDDTASTMSLITLISSAAYNHLPENAKGRRVSCVSETYTTLSASARLVRNHDYCLRRDGGWRRQPDLNSDGRRSFKAAPPKPRRYLSTSAPPRAGDPDPFPALKSPLKAIQLYPPAGRSI
jgi:hypothetical protein